MPPVRGPGLHPPGLGGSGGPRRGPRELAADFRGPAAGLLTQGVMEAPWHPLAPLRELLRPSTDSESAIGNAPALVPGPLAPGIAAVTPAAANC
jgi:hypothetical protein